MTRHFALLLIAALAASPAFAQGGGGTGGGGGRGGGSGAGDCAEGFRVFVGAELQWTANAASFGDRPGVRNLTEGHSAGRPALALTDLVAGVDDIRTIEVASCGGRSQTIGGGQLRHGQRAYYIVLSKRGAFKVVAQANGREEVVTRQVGRITIMPRE